MQEALERIVQLKRELDALRPAPDLLLPPDLQRSYDIELTYASNAIEGNTLTLIETRELIEHGITVGGKQLKEHLEATDHYEAVQWMRELALQDTPLSETTITELHRRIVQHSRKDIAGFYSQNSRRIAGSAVIFPNPRKIPQLMEQLGEELANADNSPRSAFDMHYQLVTIHPFDDGNGRTARLLMNLILLRGGYVPVSVRPEDRREYLSTLENSQLSQNTDPFQTFMHRRLAANMESYIQDLRQATEAREAVWRDGKEADDSDPDPERLGQDAAKFAAMQSMRGRGI